MPTNPTVKGRSARLPIVLWAVFAVSVGASAIILLRACGLVFPLAASLSVPGWNFCPAPPPAWSAEDARGAGLRQAAAALELELGRKQLACANLPKPPPPPLQLPDRAGPPRPQQTALLKPPPSFPAERWARKDLSLLNGCWHFGSDAKSIKGAELCDVPASNVCFNESGEGRMEWSAICRAQGSRSCAAPLTATFLNDGTLRWAVAPGLCQPDNSHSNPKPYSCSRLGDEALNCDGSILRR